MAPVEDDSKLVSMPLRRMADFSIVVISPFHSLFSEGFQRFPEKLEVSAPDGTTKGSVNRCNCNFSTHQAGHYFSVAKASLVLLGSLRDELVSSHSHALVPESGTFVIGTIHLRVGERQSGLSALKPFAQ